MRSRPKAFILYPELWGFVGLLVLCNTHLMTGALPAELVFYPAACSLANIFLHPFVHVSPYHFLLDAGAFLMLYAGLRQTSMGLRIFYVAACGAGSLLMSLMLSPVVQAKGLCGLSGVAHGLMAVTALEMLNSDERRLGAVCLGLVAVKSILEVVAGEVLFSSLHFGPIGIPVAAAHLGGVTGGAAAYGLAGAFKKLQQGFQGKQPPEPDLHSFKQRCMRIR